VDEGVALAEHHSRITALPLRNTCCGSARQPARPEAAVSATSDLVPRGGIEAAVAALAGAVDTRAAEVGEMVSARWEMLQSFDVAAADWERLEDFCVEGSRQVCRLLMTGEVMRPTGATEATAARVAEVLAAGLEPS